MLTILLLFGIALPFSSIKSAALALYNLDETEIFVQITEELIENHDMIMISPDLASFKIEFALHVSLFSQYHSEFHFKPPVHLV